LSSAALITNHRIPLRSDKMRHISLVIMTLVFLEEHQSHDHEPVPGGLARFGDGMAGFMGE
jgi:hypothetical protein